jgi:hypothetical protein
LLPFNPFRMYSFLLSYYHYFFFVLSPSSLSLFIYLFIYLFITFLLLLHSLSPDGNASFVWKIVGSNLGQC